MEKSSGMSRVDATQQDALRDYLRGAAPLILLVTLVLAIGIAAPGFASVGTLTILLVDTAVLFLLAGGVTFVIMLGGIDLSIQAVASLGSVIIARFLPSLGWAAFPLAVLAGVAVGMISGIAHVRLKIPSFIATLATGGVVAGGALFLANGRAITILEQGREKTAWITATYLGVPGVIWIAGLVALGGLFAQRFLPFGRYSAAVGAGEEAAIACGIRVQRVKVMAFAISGGLAALAGVVLAARLSSGSPNLANQQLLPAIAAVVVGGTAITGGVGHLGRTVVGALIISVVRIGMTFLGVNIFAQNIVFGIMLIVAVCITIDRGKIPVIK